MIVMKKPLTLFVAAGLLFSYISLDLVLTFTDSRSNAQAVFLAMLAYPAVVACLTGSHFGYLFCLVISAGLLFSPVFALANAPDRLLTPADIPVALTLLFLLLRKPVRDYFQQQRKAWQQKRAAKLSDYDGLQPVFLSGKGFIERSANQLFWRDGDQYLMFISDKGVSKAYQLDGLEHAELIRDKWLKFLSWHKNIMILLAPVVLLGLVIYGWVGRSTGEEHLIFLAVPMFVAMILGAIVPLKQFSYLNQLRRQLAPTGLSIKPMALLDLYANHNAQYKEKSQKSALLAAGGFLLVVVLFSLLVSPAIMEKRRADAKLQASMEQASVE